MNSSNARDLSPVRLLSSLLIRFQLRDQRGLTLLAILSVAAAVALATSLELTARSVQRQVTDVEAGLHLRIEAVGERLPESVMRRAASHPSVLSVSPFLSTTVWRESDSTPIRLLGVDFLQPESLPKGAAASIESRDPLALLGNENAVLMPRSSALRLGLEEGSHLTVHGVHGSEERTELALRGLILDPEITLSGDAFALMDVWTLQRLLGVEGWLDGIEVRLREGTDRGEIRTELLRICGASARIRSQPTPARGAEAAGPFALAAIGIGVVGTLISGLLSFVALSRMVERRSREIALMQLAGLDGRGVTLLIAASSLMLAAIGGLLGLAAGIGLAEPLCAGLARLSDLDPSLHVARAGVSQATFLTAGSVAFGNALLAGVQPILRARRSHPLEVLRARPGADPDGCTLWRSARLPLLMSFGVVACALTPSPLPASARLLLCLGLGLWLLTALGPLARRVGSPIRAALGPGPIHLKLALGQSGAAAAPVAAIAAVICGFTLVSSSLGSLTMSVSRWVERNYRGATVIHAGGPGLGPVHELIPEETIAMIRAVPGVEDVAVFFNSFPRLEGESFLLGAVSAEVLLRHGGFEGEEQPGAEVAAALLRGEAVISHAFTRRFELGVGDELRIPTREGPRSFRIAAFYRDYSAGSGSVHLDLATFDRYFRRDGAHALGLWTSQPRAEVEGEILRRTGGKPTLFFMSSEDIERAVSLTLERFRGPLRILAALSALLCIGALLTLIATGVSGRRRELELMRALGATPRLLTSLVVLDGMVACLAGITWGALLGWVTSEIARDLFFEELGWVLERGFDPGETLGFSALILGLTLLVMAIPARAAVRSGLHLAPR